MVGPLEVNEVLALLCVLVAFVATIGARLHPANTPYTSRWWRRFLVMLSFILAAQVATNVEQLYAETSLTHRVINLLEHVCFAFAGLWAAHISMRAITLAFGRSGEGGETC
ncbi:MAG TPA: hypothetical protein DGT21_13145 [Armatimonadetes bacterium]|jgi:uncharacterized membrane protein YoaK (UPF0700 family)|nr:hypothetical protein [Armatimonadota bacterium]